MGCQVHQCNCDCSPGVAAAVSKPHETDTQKVKRYEAALDQILARPPYPVVLKIAEEARHPDLTKKESA